MNEMIVSWRFIIINDIGIENFFLFQCIDCIKLELSYQVFLQVIKSKTINYEIEPKFRYISLKAGLVDLSKFEIKAHKSKKKYKVIRDGNEKSNKR